MYKIVKKLGSRSRLFRRLSSRYFYEYLSTLDKKGEVTLMNFGYVPLDSDTKPIALAPEDEDNRYFLQLYHHVLSAVDLSELDVLEVGSGRGGGAAYVNRSLAPRSMTGVDISKRAVAFSRRHHRGGGLRYLHGDAEDLPFDDDSFDVAVNIESSHCYGVMADFLGEVYRVLRPGGYLLWADIRPAEHLDSLHADARRCGFKVLKQEDITDNVLTAMALQEETNRAGVERIAPRFARRAVSHFAGLQGTYIHGQLVSGELGYFHMVMSTGG